RGAHRERELGFDADGKEIVRGNFSRRVETGGREDARRERSGGADQRLRLLRRASDFVSDDRQAALPHERFLDRIGVVERERRAAWRQPPKRPPAGARGDDRGHRIVQVFRRYHLVASMTFAAVVTRARLRAVRLIKNRLLPLSEGWIACCGHPNSLFQGESKKSPCFLHKLWKLNS